MSETVTRTSPWVDAWGPPVDAARLPPAAADATRVLVVRHGLTAWNAEQRYQGHLDVPLSDVGRAQAAALADALRGLPLDAAYTSPLGRARDTAAAVLGGRGLRAAAVPALAEFSYGDWQGRRRADCAAAHPAVVARWESDPWGVTFPGGESLDDVHRRAAPVWDEIVRTHRGERVLVSGHGHLNRVLLLHGLRGPRDAFWAVPQPNAGCVVVDVGPAGATATRLTPPPGPPA